VRRTLSGLFWVLLYIAVVLSPLWVVMRSPVPSGRDFWVELSVALGFVAFMQFGLQFVIVARFRGVTAPYGIDLILQYHRQIAFVAFLLMVVHPAILVVRTPRLVALLNPFGGTPASRWGMVSLLAFVALMLTSLVRRQLRLSYEWWRGLHILFSLLALFAALVHILLVAVYTNSSLKAGFLLLFAVAMTIVLIYLRVGRPMAMLRHPYRVVEVVRERGRSWTVAVEPVGHEGLRFAPGEFAWLTLRTPFSFDEHPFSFSSSAEAPERLEFGIKELGDFTSRIGELAPGTTVYLEGPHGSFSVDRQPAAGYVLIAGGIGISPMISMIRTLADRGDRRPVMLIYGTRTLENAAYYDQLEELKPRMALEVVHILEEPHAEWSGEKGWITTDVLRRVLPKERITRAIFVCGPGPMMDAVERALLECGVPPRAIHMERFDLV
jgi:predicted ferric reductase